MNWDMLGHEWAVNLLKEHVVHSGVRHAYLLTGPQGIGRRTLALRLAQALNCPQPVAPGEPCQVCRTCLLIERMQHPDLAVIQAEQRGGILRVEQIRDLQRGLALAPYESLYRVAIILRFEEANQSASNALLKTLEEPASPVIIILTADSVESLLPTIVSRSEVLRLHPLPVEPVSQWLQNHWQVPDDQARLIASVSGGRPGRALCLHRNPDLMAQRGQWLTDHLNLLETSRIERFRFAEVSAKDKERDTLQEMLVVWLSFWRDVLLSASHASCYPTNPDQGAVTTRLAELLGLSGAYRVVYRLERTMDLIQHNINARLALEVLMLDLPVFLAGVIMREEK